LKRHAQVVGWGKYVPAKVLTNEDLARLVDTSDQWIRERTGISERRVAAPRETTATMAIQAAQEALKVADVDPARLDLIIVATATPDYAFPSVACLVQDALGASRAGAFDLAAGCSGFVYALATAAQFIQTGAYDTIMVIGAETLSRVVDFTDRNTCVLFGDGAGAVLLRPNADGGGLLSFVLGADGSGADLLILPGGGSKHPASLSTVEERLHYVKMDGREVFRFAVNVMGKAASQAIKAANLGLGSVDLLIPHQANLRIIQSAAKSLKLPPEKVFVNLEKYGNTSAASIPIALCEAIEDGRVRPGDHLVLVGFGAGLTWAAAVLKWGPVAAPVPVPWWKMAWHRVRGRLYAFRSALIRLWRRLDALLGGGKEPG